MVLFPGREESGMRSPKTENKSAVLRIRIRDLGSGIRDWVPFWPLDPGSGIRDWRKSASGSGIRDEQPGSYFLELRNHFLLFFWLKYLNSLMRIRDPGWRQFGSEIRDGKMSDPGSGIRDKHPGPPHCKSANLMKIKTIKGYIWMIKTDRKSPFTVFFTH